MSNIILKHIVQRCFNYIYYFKTGMDKQLGIMFYVQKCIYDQKNKVHALCKNNNYKRSYNKFICHIITYNF